MGLSLYAETMKTLIGSQALSLYMDVVPKDVDYFSDRPVEEAETFYDPRLEAWSWGETATLNELYTIKVSHSYWELKNNSWVKHMFHITKMQELNAELLPELHNILYSIWEERYGKKKANLNQEPEDFFNSNVSRVYEHDSIHSSVAYRHGYPLFNEILRDGHAVAVDKNKFDALDLTEKLQLVREEVYATALERMIIPSEYSYNPSQAYFWALRKTITSFTKGWFPQFIVENFLELRKPDINYVEKHRNNSNLLVRI